MRSKITFPPHGYFGLTLVLIFWAINWTFEGLRTHWAFFPLWLGYCLSIDGLVYFRTGTSLLTRSWKKYLMLFAISAPAWWLFEAINLRTQNWLYLGADQFSLAEYAFWTTLSFTTVLPAVFGSAELMSSFRLVNRIGRGPKVGDDRRTTTGFFILGWIMLALLLLWPGIFFPFVWISLYFIL